MENVSITVSPDKKKATIVVDLTHRGDLSSTGKTIRVASTEGNTELEGTGVKIGLNAFTRPAKS
jgi:hypothetical protein